MAKNLTGTNPMYVYVGQGFIAGLPKTVTMEEAKQLGLLEELKAAIANGAYVETPLSPAVTSPQMEERHLGDKAKE